LLTFSEKLLDSRLAVALLKNKLVLIVVAVFLLGGGGTYYFLFMGKKDTAEAKKKGHDGDKHPDSDEDSEAHGSKEHSHDDEEARESEKHEDGENGEEEAGDEEEASSDGHSGGHGESKGPVIDPFVVNLADPNSRRYLRMNMKLEFTKPEENEPLLMDRMPQVRDAVLLLLSSKSSEQLLSPEGKTNLRKELIDQLNIVLTNKKIKKVKKIVKNLYFTEFLIQ
jgi:flagellar FliL protein